VEKSVSGGRKIFRFLKFMEDFRTISEMLYESFTPYKILKLLSCIAGSFYHILDNINWASNIGIIDDYLTEEIQWRTSKNFFNLLRKSFRLIGDIYKIVNYSLSLRKINIKLRTEKDDDNLLTISLEIRSKIGYKMLSFISSILRILMILYSLKLEPYYSNIHPIYTGLCGFLYSILAMIKQLIKHKTDDLIKYEKGAKRVKTEEQLYEEFVVNNKHMLDDQYFMHYYIDFNK